MKENPDAQVWFLQFIPDFIEPNSYLETYKEAINYMNSVFDKLSEKYDNLIRAEVTFGIFNGTPLQNVITSGRFQQSS